MGPPTSLYDQVFLLSLAAELRRFLRRLASHDARAPQGLQTHARATRPDISESFVVHLGALHYSRLDLPVSLVVYLDAFLANAGETRQRQFVDMASDAASASSIYVLDLLH